MDDFTRLQYQVTGLLAERDDLAARLAASERQRQALVEALDELVTCGFTGDEMRLMLVGFGGRQVSPELHQRCDRVTAAKEKARAALAAAATPEVPSGD